ncbi:MAG TPA: hypothetical protein VFH70_03940, partial [Acidimicrobiales bacterium]|nr:hypothetical protein [Acidimicrobiales bacterium]
TMLGQALALQPAKGRIDGTVDCLDELAALSLDRGDASGAARLAGAADAILDRAGFRRVPAREEAARATTAAMQQQFDRTALAAERSAGAAASDARPAGAAWRRLVALGAEAEEAVPGENRGGRR